MYIYVYISYGETCSKYGEIFLFIHVSICIHASVCTYVYMYIHMYMYMYIHVYAYIHVHICIHLTERHGLKCKLTFDTYLMYRVV